MPPQIPPFWLQVPVARGLQLTDRFDAPRSYPPAFKHEGIDLAALDGRGNPVSVLAAQVGIVERVGDSPSGYGKFVRIVHQWGDETYKTWYAHLSVIFATQGQFVLPGDVIGVAGTTGNSTGVHLHLTLQHIGRGKSGYSVDDVIDPESLLVVGPQPPFDMLALVADVTVRDGAVMMPGSSFEKIWRVRNVGTRAWQGYHLTFTEGDRMNGPESVPIPDTAPGGVTSIALPLIAPLNEGLVRSAWAATDDSGRQFVQVLDVLLDVHTPPPVSALEFVADVTHPDGSVIQPGTEFTKTWRVRNAGGTTWSDGFTLGYFAERRMQGADSAPLPRTAPGEIVDLSVRLKAPTTAGRYRTVWKPRTPDGKFFEHTLHADIVVPRLLPPRSLDQADFVADVTIPDNSVMAPGQVFVKTWRIRNAGNTTWGNGYTFAFFSGTQMGAPRSVNAPAAAPGQEVEVSIQFTAPRRPGTYNSVWKFRNRQGRFFEFDMFTIIEVKP